MIIVVMSLLYVGCRNLPIPFSISVKTIPKTHRIFSATPSTPTPFAELVGSLPNQTATTAAPSPFMKYGESYGGQSASRILGQTLSEVAVGVTLDNWSRWALVEPEVEMECGTVVVRRVDDLQEGDDSDGEESSATVEVGLPELVKPGFSEFVMFEKQV